MVIISYVFLFLAYLVYFYKGSEGFGIVMLGGQGVKRKNIFRLDIARHDSPYTTAIIFLPCSPSAIRKLITFPLGDELVCSPSYSRQA